MDAWRLRLLLVTVVGSLAGYGWLYLTASPKEQVSLHLLLAMFVLVGAGMLVVYRRQLTLNVVTAQMAFGAIVHLVVAGIFVAGNRFSERGLLLELSDSWVHLLAGAIGVAAALASWSRARPRPAETPPLPVADRDEPPPPPSAPLEGEPDWAALHADLKTRGDTEGVRHLVALERLAAVLDGDAPDRERLEEATRILRQEVLRLNARSAARARSADDEDALTQVAEFFEWGVQKLPELARLDVPDLLLAHVVAEIRATSSGVEHELVDHRALVPIHPVDRPTAEAKADERAAAARAALGLLRANGMRLTEDLIGGHEELEAFRSVTGFQVVDMGDGYVTFEGNGRAAALQRAFDDDVRVLVEVRHYLFDDADAQERVRRHVRRVQRSNGVLDPGTGRLTAGETGRYRPSLHQCPLTAFYARLSVCGAKQRTSRSSSR